MSAKLHTNLNTPTPTTTNLSNNSNSHPMELDTPLASDQGKINGRNFSILLSSPYGIQTVSSFLTSADLSCLCSTSQALKLNVDKKKIWQKVLYQESKSVFGPEAWKTYFGNVGDVPPLSSDLFAKANGVRLKTTMKTHLLLLIPATVDDVPLTINHMGKLTKTPKQGHPIGYHIVDSSVLNEHGNRPITTKSYWVWVTKDMLPRSRGKFYSAQQAIAKKLGYQVIKAGVAVLANMTHYVRTGERLYKEESSTYTRCQEQVYNMHQLIVGGFSPSGLVINYSYDIDHKHLVVAGMLPCGSSEAMNP